MAKQNGAKKSTASKVTEDERLRMIAEAAYHRAEARSFAGGNPDEDWLAAEAEVDVLLKGSKKPVAKAASGAKSASESKSKSTTKPKAKAGSKPKSGTKAKSAK